jgi:hypothetical protein
VSVAAGLSGLPRRRLDAAPLAAGRLNGAWLPSLRGPYALCREAGNEPPGRGRGDSSRTAHGRSRRKNRCGYPGVGCAGGHRRRPAD